MRRHGFFFLIITILISGCLKDAPRQNPFDPKSDLYKDTGSISGYVTNYYLPYIGIDDAELKIIPGYQGARSDADGFFRIERVIGGQYLIVASKSGYASDSTIIVVKNGRETSLSFKLDALPTFTESKISSLHISRWFPRPYDIFYIYFQVKVDDPDGSSDITLVTVHCEEIGLVDTLGFLSSTEIYQKVMDLQEINTFNPADVVGRSMLFTAKDKAGNQNNSSPIYLTRIIFETPVALSPTSLQLVNTTPQLIWKAMDLMFSFTHRIEVYRTDIPIPTLVWSQENIASTDTTIIVSDSLETGRYYWAVTIVDEFSNWSRSKEASFQIE